jgi:hypothetical protein
MCRLFSRALLCCKAPSAFEWSIFPRIRIRAPPPLPACTDAAPLDVDSDACVLVFLRIGNAAPIARTANLKSEDFAEALAVSAAIPGQCLRSFPPGAVGRGGDVRIPEDARRAGAIRGGWREPRDGNWGYRAVGLDF